MHPSSGRGSLSAPASRFLSATRLTFLEDATPQDDWAEMDQPASSLETVIQEEKAKSILSHNDSPDVPFRTSLNAYRGCEHGCIYCYARPSHAYVDLSPGRDFETRIFAKRNAVELLEKEFQKKNYIPETIVLGANTDPYQPAERAEKLTRSILELCHAYGHPVAITTKNHMILHDLDILGKLARKNLVSVNLSVTSLDGNLSSRMEPRASSPGRRLQALKALNEERIPAGVLLAPVIPGLNDAEIEKIVSECARNGALWLSHILIRLPHEIRDLFTEWLEHHFPEKKDRILHLIKSIRQGKLNDPRFGHRMTGSGNYASLIHMRVKSSVIRYGIPQQNKGLRKDLFLRAPGGQPDLFG